MVTKINPTTDYAVGRAFLGKTITPINIDFIADCSAENGPGEAIEGVLNQITSIATIAAYGALYDSDTQMTVFVEGEYPTDTYDGTNSETFVAYLQSVVRLLGNEYGPNDFDLSAATVTASAAAEGYSVMKADQV
jgi:hypothetical protein